MYLARQVIRYTDTLEGISAAQLSGGFFEGWPDPPSPETHLRILAGSGEVLLAVDEESGAVAGFAAAVTDGVLCAHITLLEVLPSYRAAGAWQGARGAHARPAGAALRGGRDLRP